ncbi:MAG: dTDP-4-dehydrorhamnose reductase [Gemmatimonadota bacterium]|jgi:dTDP-4-dehydrorhamnose reductase
MRILLTGATGQLGHELQRWLTPLGSLVACTRADCDLERPAQIREVVRRSAPDVIVNPAAYTAVDRAESEPDRAAAVNRDAVAVLAEEARRIGATIIHYSTDYVFDGTKAGWYVEDDMTAPLGVYGRTKCEGEEVLRASGIPHLILRTSWVVGTHGANFARTMLRLASTHETLRVVTDQVGAPTSTALIAEVTVALLRQMGSGGRAFPYGTYHVAAHGETTWHAYAQFVFAEAGLDPARVLPTTTAAYPTPARRPANSRLDTTRVRSTFGIELPDWSAGVREVMRGLEAP